MCVAIIKPAGVELPADDILERCFIHNPDGAGLAVPYGNEFYISKGYFNFEEYLDIVKEEVTTDEMAFLHMRIATMGEVNASNCHPFVVTDDYERMSAIEVSNAESVMMHNGTFDMNNENLQVSDTMTFNKAVYSAGIDPFAEQSRFLIEQIAGVCRVAYAKGDEVVTFGNWTDHEGCLYSNDSYRRPVYPKYTTWSKNWKTGGKWVMGGYMIEKDWLEAEQLDQVVYGACPMDGAVLTDLHKCPECKNDYSKIVRWLNEAPVKKLRLSGLSEETIKYWLMYGKETSNAVR